ncbi:MAG: hypothetical protein ACM31H_00405 [Nitrososphaerales archaeon]
MKQSKNKIRKRGNTPVFLRAQVSNYMLRKYPQYKDLFQKCVSCGKNSLKPVGVNHIKDVSKTKDINTRKCGLCGYTHVRDLVVSTIDSSARAPINVTESIDAIKKGRILL